MIFFDFLFYLIYRFYSAYNETGAEFSSAGTVGGLQAMNVLTAIIAFQYVFGMKTNIDKIFVIVLFIIFQVFTYYRYIYKDSHTAAIMEEKWESKPTACRKQISTWLLLYEIVSVIGLFGLVIYLGDRNRF